MPHPCPLKKVTFHRFLVALSQGTPKPSETAWCALLTLKAKSKLVSYFGFRLEEFCFKEAEEQESAGKRGGKILHINFSLY